MSKKKHKAVEAKALTPVVPDVVTPEIEKEDDNKWEWTQPREECLDMLFKGVSQRGIATQLGVHYNTIGNWIKHPSFQQRLSEISAAHHAQVRMQRIQQTNMFTSRVAKLADTTLKEAEAHPNSAVAAEKARSWLDEFRSFREEERVNSGENIQRHQITGMVGHVHSGVRQASFKNFLENAIDKGIIDVESIETTGDNAGDIVAALVQHALRAGDMLDVITEEDRQQALADGEVPR